MNPVFRLALAMLAAIPLTACTGSSTLPELTDTGARLDGGQVMGGGSRTGEISPDSAQAASEAVANPLFCTVDDRGVHMMGGGSIVGEPGCP